MNSMDDRCSRRRFGTRKRIRFWKRGSGTGLFFRPIFFKSIITHLLHPRKCYAIHHQAEKSDNSVSDWSLFITRNLFSWKQIATVLNHLFFVCPDPVGCDRMEIRHTLKIAVPKNAVEGSKIIEGMILESWEAIKLEPWKYMSLVVV